MSVSCVFRCVGCFGGILMYVIPTGCQRPKARLPAQYERWESEVSLGECLPVVWMQYSGKHTAANFAIVWAKQTRRWFPLDLHYLYQPPRHQMDRCSGVYFRGSATRNSSVRLCATAHEI